MKLIEAGADIPSELIRAVNDGDVIFLCGAGVSRGVGLPSFQKLTADIYASLGESPANEAAERIASDRGEYDRVSDVDVPSVAAHEQNAFHEGFLPIVRVIAELWSRLIQKDTRAASDIMHEWQRSGLRLVHRLALYAAADPLVSPRQAAEVLIHLPQGELFLTNSQVEVHRLMRSRWSEFPAKQRQLIEARIIDGPPVDWFREGADLSRPMDRCRFLLLLDLERSGVPLGKEASNLLRKIRERHPTWGDVEPEKVGFAMWHGSVTPVVGEKEKLASVPSGQLILAAKKAAEEASYMDGDSWQDLCREEPITAFSGIENAPTSERWHEWAWRPLLWASTKITDVNVLSRMATLLARWPETALFEETASGAAFWMDQVSDKLKARILWKLWDFIERRSPRRTEILNDDVFTVSLNDPSGNLASVLLKRTPRSKGQVELGKNLRIRYEKLIGSEDAFSLLARVRHCEPRALQGAEGGRPRLSARTGCARLVRSLVTDAAPGEFFRCR
jgi:hypothetical protein